MGGGQVKTDICPPPSLLEPCLSPLDLQAKSTSSVLVKVVPSFYSPIPCTQCATTPPHPKSLTVNSGPLLTIFQITPSWQRQVAARVSQATPRQLWLNNMWKCARNLISGSMGGGCVNHCCMKTQAMCSHLAGGQTYLIGCVCTVNQLPWQNIWLHCVVVACYFLH